MPLFLHLLPNYSVVLLVFHLILIGVFFHQRVSIVTIVQIHCCLFLVYVVVLFLLSLCFLIHAFFFKFSFFFLSLLFLWCFFLLSTLGVERVAVLSSIFPCETFFPGLFFFSFLFCFLLSARATGQPALHVFLFFLRFHYLFWFFFFFFC